MPPIDFPDSPSEGDLYSFGGYAWVFNGEAWVRPAWAPDDFTLTDQTDVTPSSTITSAGVQISGITAPVRVSILGGQFQTADDSGFTSNASAWTNFGGEVAPDQYIRVRHTSGAEGIVTNTTLTVGGGHLAQSDTFSSTAYTAFIPNDITLTDQTNVEQNVTATSVGSQVTRASGGVGPTPVSVSGGQYQTASDSGFTSIVTDWTSSPGTIAQNHYVRARHTTATNWSTGASCTVTVGPPGNTQNDTFNTTTRAATDAYLTSTGAQNWPIPSGYYPGNNLVEVIGGGGGSAPIAAPASASSTGGGGGGGYARKANVNLTPFPSTAPYVVGAGGPASPSAPGGQGGETWFAAPGTVRATGGAWGGTAVGAPAPQPGGAGGSGTAGDTTRTGGTGGNSLVSAPASRGGGGGGGAAGFGGNGGNGGTGTTGTAPNPALATAGGGGGSGGSSGAGNNGGPNSIGPGGSGGGANGGAAGAAPTGNGGAGGNGTAFPNGTQGSGGGGGGGLSSPGTGGAGGLYGGGAGGAGGAPSGAKNGNAGGQGIIHVRY